MTMTKDAFAFDSSLTGLLLQSEPLTISCPPVRPPSPSSPGTFKDYCDMGPSRTPVQHDSASLVRVPSTRTLPCSYFTREGVRVEAVDALKDGQHLYAVAAGRLFQFAPSYIGEEFHLPHVPHPEGKKIYLKTLSVEPKVFEIEGFFVEAEADDIVRRAKTEKSESHKLKRSSTGADGYNVNPTRTSENAFDTHSKSAMDLKRRCFDVLGIRPYKENMADGLQVLRYNVTTAYIGHLDWIDPSPAVEHDFVTDGKGSNRFATILLYMTDMDKEEGGETVWTRATSLDEGAPGHAEALSGIRADPELSKLFKQGSWEEKMVATCRSKLAVTPKRAKSVLFYSQLPDGTVDKASEHGGCPVLTDKKQKWAANLWVWNAPRMGYPEAPNKTDKKGDARRKPPKSPSPPPEKKQPLVVFSNPGENPEFNDAVLYFGEEQRWGDFGPGQVHRVNSFDGHVFNVKVGGKVVKSWRVGPEAEQKFVI